LAAATAARATPVLPLVGSMMTEPGLRRPFRSASSIMARPMRSFTLDQGLKDSTLARIVAGSASGAGDPGTVPLGRWRIRMRGVLPTSSVMFSAYFMCFSFRS
jgi:hypothetical protein